VLKRFRRELGLILAWLIFPLAPVILEDFYFQTGNRGGPDPRIWGWLTWLIMLGPLVGYGFLAGATVRVPDEDLTSRRALGRLLGRRAVWVAIGPWWGALVCAGMIYGLLYLERLGLGFFDWTSRIQQSYPSTWAYWLISWAISILLLLLFAYSWIWPALSALRRAARIGQCKQSLVRGIVMAAAFVGSLFGSFWAVTAVWRSYFFDPRIVRLLVVALGLTVMSGCASTITYGEVRRRELFHAMLVAWVLGLALMWRWWSRSRAGRPPVAPG
jgi:hypothetical protein